MYTKIEYRTFSGHMITHEFDEECGITVSDIDQMAMKYFEAAGREPEVIFMDIKHYHHLVMQLATTSQLQNIMSDPATLGTRHMRFILSMGEYRVTIVANSYIPVFVGSRAEYDDNDVNKHFEEIVLGGCERV